MRYMRVKIIFTILLAQIIVVECEPPEERDYYKDLNVPTDATARTIKSAYRTLSKQHHPDHHKNDGTRQQELNVAYDVLSDTDNRTRYDNARAEAELQRRIDQSVVLVKRVVTAPFGFFWRSVASCFSVARRHPEIKKRKE